MIEMFSGPVRGAVLRQKGTQAPTTVGAGE